MSEQQKILIVDDEENLALFLRKIIESDPEINAQALVAHSGEKAMEIIQQDNPDLVLCDIKLTSMNGLEVLSKAKDINPEIEVIMMTGFASVDSAIKAMREGAFDYINKPFDTQELKNILKKALLKKNQKYQREKLLTELKNLNVHLKNEKKILEIDLELKTEELERLQNLSQILSESIGLAPLIKIIPKILTLTLNCDGAFLSWYSEETHTLTVRSSYQVSEYFPRGVNLDCSHSPFDLVFKEKQSPLVISNYSISSEKFVPTLALAQLLGGEKPFGLIGVIYKETNDQADKKKFLNLLYTASAIICLAIKNSQFFETVKRQELGILSFILYLAENFGWSRDKLQEIAILSVTIGKKLDLDEAIIKSLRYASLSLSLGYITSGSNDITTAVKYAMTIISPLDWLTKTLNTMKYTPENFDGSGTHQLKGNKIPVASRILRCVYDYTILKDTKDVSFAIDYLEQKAGKVYDPHMVKILGTII
ncbi:MAG: response regulator [bacterium]